MIEPRKNLLSVRQDVTLWPDTFILDMYSPCSGRKKGNHTRLAGGKGEEGGSASLEKRAVSGYIA